MLDGELALGGLSSTARANIMMLLTMVLLMLMMMMQMMTMLMMMTMVMSVGPSLCAQAAHSLGAKSIAWGAT